MSIDKNRSCTPTTVKVHRCVSVLPNDYSILENLPKLNGVTLLGDLSAQQLNLLSANGSDYETISPDDTKGKYILVLGEGDEKPSKISIVHLPTSSDGSGFLTTDILDPNVKIGIYQFVEKNKKEN